MTNSYINGAPDYCQQERCCPEKCAVPTGTTIHGSPEHDDIIFSSRTLPLAFRDHSLLYDFARGD